MDYNAAKLPECLRCLLAVRPTYRFAHYALLSSISSLARFNVVGRQREESGLSPGHHWQPIIVAGVVATNNAGHTEGRGPDISPGSNDGLGGLSQGRASAVSIRGRVGYFCTDRTTWGTRLHSTEAYGVLTSQVKRGVVESSSTKQGARMIFRTKLDGPATRNTGRESTRHM